MTDLNEARSAAYARDLAEESERLVAGIAGVLQRGYGDASIGVLDLRVARDVLRWLGEQGTFTRWQVAALVEAAGGKIVLDEDRMLEPLDLLTVRDTPGRVELRTRRRRPPSAAEAAFLVPLCGAAVLPASTGLGPVAATVEGYYVVGHWKASYLLGEQRQVDGVGVRASEDGPTTYLWELPPIRRYLVGPGDELTIRVPLGELKRLPG
ncbi:hypothetical protein AB0F93_00285 [Micromonospora tulbaghiae]|uniref:hypothetical protein n=1 Tax=Micromonospora tulbaghiae TaxID=479978 RepID=UPI003318E964